MQTARSDFAAWLRGRAAAGSVCVVGNAGSLLTQAWGARIDAQAVVIRFNRWQPPDQDVAQAVLQIDAVVERQGDTARIAEYDVDVLVGQLLDLVRRQRAAHRAYEGLRGAQGVEESAIARRTSTVLTA